MKYCLVVFALFINTVIIAQEKNIDSRITNVTVFLNRAQITREAKSRIDAGKSTIVLKGLTSQLDPQSIQVEGKGSFTILGISHQQNYLNELSLPKAVLLLRDSIELIQRQITLETTQKDILNKEEQMLLSNQKIGGTNQNLTAAELKAMADFFRSRLKDIAAEKIKQDVIIRKLNELMQKLQRQYGAQNELYNRNSSEIAIAVSAESATNADFVVSYVVGNAGWVAQYDLRGTNTKNPIQLSYKANVFQATGEDWKNVKLKLSTANPSLGGIKPELSPWFLSFYEPVIRNLQERVVAGRADKKYKTSAPSAPAMEAEEAPAQTVADFVQTIQTSLNTEFDIALPYTITSANKPVTVDIRNHELKATYQYSTAPKLDVDAFLMARATGWEDLSLLPGEANVFFEGSFVGKSFIDPNSIRDTLAISLGRDKRIVVKREKVKDFSSRKAIGTQQRDAYAYELTVRNSKSEPITIVVEDQLPVSQDSQIEVSAVDTGGASFNKANGKLSWTISLNAGESKKFTYKFEVKYPKGKIVSGLD